MVGARRPGAANLRLGRAEGRVSAIPLTIYEHAGVARTNEIAYASVPLPQGMARATQAWCVRSASGETLPCHARPLALWQDDTIQWMAVAFPATLSGGQTASYELLPTEGAASTTVPQIRVSETDVCYEIDTGGGCLRMPKRGSRLIEEISISDAAMLTRSGVQARLRDQFGVVRTVELVSVEAVERGPLVARVRWTGRIPRTGLLARGEWTFRAGSACSSLDVTLHNPSRARHYRGCWDLGDPGSVLFRSFSLGLQLAGSETPRIRWRDQLTAAWQEQAGGRFAIQQHTSGGENDRSRNHVNRHGEMFTGPRGYTVRSSTGEQLGARANPICLVQCEERWAAAGIHEFWQQFPKSLSADTGALEIGAFPELQHDLHELQGGEQKTTRIALTFGGTSIAPDAQELLAVLAPLEVRCDSSWIAQTGALWRLPRSQGHLRPEWQTVAQHAVGGERGFFAKREAADEYGWRNFGDLWADHEEAHYDGPKPIVSHYNNQYDALEGFLLAYLTTGDRRFWELADPLARHVIDIDIYHTTQDRAAYNGGQFWHTNHFRDAATSTHRAYSQANHPEGGGGPSNEQNYSSGLLLYHYLTGNELAREAVVSLAEWVINMDDGRGHVLGLFDESPTGFASRTAENSYHGPGRGAGNSINTLLDGWLATQRRGFLRKLEELVRRTIHPDDEIAALDLANAERRWSYTVFLQSLVRCLAVAEQCSLSDGFAAHIRASLLHYARWMSENETFYLDRPEQLEYPTETWAAQEIRKANILTAAAHLADDKEASKFRMKAEWFYDRAWTTLMSFPTWHYTRPTVLALQLGLYSALYADKSSFPSTISSLSPQQATPRLDRFIPQKEAVRRGLRSPPRLLAMLARTGRVWRWRDHWKSTWTAQRVRRMWSGIHG
jgi:hypothetical protein